MIDLQQQIADARTGRGEEIKWAIVQVIRGEATNSIGPFDTRVEAEAHVLQVKSRQDVDSSEWTLGGVFVVPQVGPQDA